MPVRFILPPRPKSRRFWPHPSFPPATCYLDTLRMFVRGWQRPNWVVGELLHAGVGDAGCDEAFSEFTDSRGRKIRQHQGWTIFTHQPSEPACHMLGDAQDALGGVVSRWDLAADWGVIGDYDRLEDFDQLAERHEWLVRHLLLLYRRRANSVLTYKPGGEESGALGTHYWVEHRGRKSWASSNTAATEMALYSDRAKLTPEYVNHLELRHYHPRPAVRVRDLLHINPAQHFANKVKLVTLDVVSERKKMLRARSNEERVEVLIKELQQVDVQRLHDRDWMLQTLPMTILRLPDRLSFAGDKSLQGHGLEKCRVSHVSSYGPAA
jgi:hypothetical protein